MRTVNDETRLRIVIEKPQVPGDRVMAGLAVIRKPAIVRIVFSMTAHATVIGIGEHFGFMAGLALDIVMLSQERESRQVVVEHRHVLPFRLAVAIVAPVTLFAVVRVVIDVAGAARRTRRGSEYGLDVTVGTGDVTM